MRRSIVSLLLGAGLVWGSAVSCGGSRDDANAVTVARSALTAATDIFGFESPAYWSTTTTGAVLASSTTHSQGSFSLQVQPSTSNGYTPIASIPLSTLSGVSPTLAWDIMLPTEQPNPNWFGTAQVYLNCPSRNIFSQFLGQVELTGKPLNVWNTVSFPLTNADVTGLLQAGYTDLTVTVVLNVQVPTTGVYRIDNLRFIPAPANGCGGWPNGTSCTDGNACTQSDTCQAGACVGANPVVCTAQDQCHAAGTCNQATGACSNPALVDGTTCNDGNACTQTDACRSGVCTGANPIVCPTGNQCNTDVCDPTSGACSLVPVADGTSCDDGNTCSSGDTCQSGACGGTVDSLCQLSIRFEEIVDLGGGAKAAIFSYTNPGTSSVSAPYGSGNFISVDGQMVAAPAASVPTSFVPGDHPGALSYPLPAGATTMSWTLGAHVATASGAAQPLGTTSGGAPAVTVTNAAGSPMLVAYDATNADVRPAVVFTVTPSAITIPQGGTAAVTLNVEYVGLDGSGLSSFLFAESDVGPPGGPNGLNDRLVPQGSATPPSAYNWMFQADPTALLGQNNIFLTTDNLLPGQPSVSLTVTVVSPPASVVNLATIGVKGPLAMLADQPWSVSVPNNDEFFTDAPIPSSIAEGTAPHWISGEGYTIQDGNPSLAFPEVRVQSSQVNFQANISFSDDTSALAMTATAENADPYNVGTGVTSCTTSLFPGVVEGNHGRYKLRIQRWDETATTCQTPDGQTNADLPPVSFSDPKPLGKAGCWVDMGFATSDLYGSETVPDVLGLGINGPSAPKDGTVSGVITVPVTLSQVATYVRYVVSVSEGDTRVPNDVTAGFWSVLQEGNPNQTDCDNLEGVNGNSQFPDLLTIPTTGQGYACYLGPVDPTGPLFTDAIAPFCPPATPNGTNEGPIAHWNVSRPSAATGTTGGFNYEQALNPFLVVVEPVAVAQLKVLPWTILYQAPGDKSSTAYAVTESYGTNMTTTSVLNQTQTNAVDNKTTSGTTDSTGMTGATYKNLTTVFPDLAPGGTVGTFLTKANFGVVAMTSTSTTWDNSTTLGSGRATQAAVSQVANFQQVYTNTLDKNGNTTLVPGATGAYAQEPFWGDTLLLLVHPQLGLWQIGGQNAVILLGAQGGIVDGINKPTVFPATVLELDQCARRVPGHENGLVINTSTHNPPDSTDVLTADDCQQLLQLDPFYPVGQTLPAAPNARIAFVTSQGYGTSGTTGSDGSHSDLNVSLQQVLTYSTVTTATNVASYTSAATNVFTTMSSDSTSLSAFGFSAGDNSSQSQSMTNASNLTVQFQSSFAATAQSSIGVTGTLDDDHVFPTKPAAFIYQDAVFGTFMFQDKDAPLAPQ